MPLTKVSYSMINGGVFNVLDFGAVTTAGVDNSAAFQAALNAANAVAGAVYVPAGMYRLNSQLLIGSNTRIFGDGMYRTILEAANTFDGDGLIKSNGAGGPPTIIENMAILGQAGIGAGPNSVAVNATINAVQMHHLWVGGFKIQFIIDGTDCHCFDCWADVSLSGGYGFVITNPGNSLLDCTTYNCYVGILIQPSNYWITNEPYGGVQITNQKIAAGAYRGIDMNAALNVTISNLHIIGNGTNQYAGGAISITNGKNISINQYTVNFGNTPAGFAYGLIQTGNSESISLTNSNITSCVVGASFGSVVGLTVTGNQFYRNSLGGFKLSGNNAGVSITGNVAEFNGTSANFLANASYGFWIEHGLSSGQYAISGNTVLDSTSIQYYGFYLSHANSPPEVAFTGNAAQSDGVAYSYNGAGVAKIINQATNAT